MLPIKKIYVDSRMRTKDSISSSDFAIDLPNNLLMPENTVFYVDDVTIPVSWYNVNDNNNILYITATVFINSVGHSHFLRVIIPPANYSTQSLANQIAIQLKSAFEPISSQTVDVTYSVDTLKNNFTIRLPTWIQMIVMDDDRIVIAAPTQGWGNGPYSSINGVIGNYISKNEAKYWTSGYVNLFSVRNIYIRSSNLGTYSTMSLRGDRDIIKKVPVNAGPNEVIFNSVMVAQDYLDCSRQTLSRMYFKLEDVDGNLLDLNGFDWSFSLIFAKFDSEL